MSVLFPWQLGQISIYHHTFKYLKMNQPGGSCVCVCVLNSALAPYTGSSGPGGDFLSIFGSPTATTLPRDQIWIKKPWNPSWDTGTFLAAGVDAQKVYLSTAVVADCHPDSWKQTRPQLHH